MTSDIVMFICFHCVGGNMVLIDYLCVLDGSLAYQRWSVDNREIVAIKERGAQSTKKGCTQQTGCDLRLWRTHTKVAVVIQTHVRGVVREVKLLLLKIKVHSTSTAAALGQTSGSSIIYCYIIVDWNDTVRMLVFWRTLNGRSWTIF